jgi:hypothetical protein
VFRLVSITTANADTDTVTNSGPINRVKRLLENAAFFYFFRNYSLSGSKHLLCIELPLNSN